MHPLISHELVAQHTQDMRDQAAAAKLRAVVRAAGRRPSRDAAAQVSAAVGPKHWIPRRA
jgi:hypothetical protein